MTFTTLWGSVLLLGVLLTVGRLLRKYEPNNGEYIHPDKPDSLVTDETGEDDTQKSSHSHLGEKSQSATSEPQSEDSIAGKTTEDIERNEEVTAGRIVRDEEDSQRNTEITEGVFVHENDS